MANSIEREIIRILTEAGEEGLAVRHITRHVYNANNELFKSVNFESISQSVRNYLHLAIHRPSPLIERTDRGVYRLNSQSKKVKQLQFEFGFIDTEQHVAKPAVDEGPGLFDNL